MHKKSLGIKGNLKKKNDSLNPTQGTLLKRKKRNTLPFSLLFGPETIKKKRGDRFGPNETREKSSFYLALSRPRRLVCFVGVAFLLRSEEFSRVVRSAYRENARSHIEEGPRGVSRDGVHFSVEKKKGASFAI